MRRVEAVIEQAETVVREVRREPPPLRVDRRYRAEMEQQGQLRLPATAEEEDE